MPSLPICVQGAGGSGVKWVQRVRGQVTQRSGLSVVVWGGLWPPPWSPETCSQACSSVARVQFPCLRSEIPHPRWLTYSRDLSPLPGAMHPLVMGALPIQPIQGTQIPPSLPSSNFPFSQQPEKATCSTSPLPSTRVGNGVGTLRPVHRDIWPQQAYWSPGRTLQTGAPCRVDIGGPSPGKPHPGFSAMDGSLGPVERQQLAAWAGDQQAPWCHP